MYMRIKLNKSLRRNILLDYTMRHKLPIQKYFLLLFFLKLTCAKDVQNQHNIIIINKKPLCKTKMHTSKSPISHYYFIILDVDRTSITVNF